MQERGGLTGGCGASPGSLIPQPPKGADLRGPGGTILERIMTYQIKSRRDNAADAPNDELGQSRGKWTGQVQVGNRTMAEDRARKELES